MAYSNCKGLETFCVALFPFICN